MKFEFCRNAIFTLSKIPLNQTMCSRRLQEVCKGAQKENKIGDLKTELNS
jgi:hypothetical protein